MLDILVKMLLVTKKNRATSKPYKSQRMNSFSQTRPIAWVKGKAIKGKIMGKTITINHKITLRTTNATPKPYAVHVISLSKVRVFCTFSTELTSGMDIRF